MQNEEAPCEIIHNVVLTTAWIMYLFSVIFSFIEGVGPSTLSIMLGPLIIFHTLKLDDAEQTCELLWLHTFLLIKYLPSFKSYFYSIFHLESTHLLTTLVITWHVSRSINYISVCQAHTSIELVVSFGSKLFLWVFCHSSDLKREWLLGPSEVVWQTLLEYAKSPTDFAMGYKNLIRASLIHRIVKT